MIRVLKVFVKGMLVFPPTVWLWLALLMTANMVLPLVFIASLEGQVVFLCMLIGAMLQMAIIARLGFVRLLGLGHILWLLLVPWLWGRLELHQPGTSFRYFLAGVMVINTISVLIDAADVVRWMRGERTPTLTVDDV